jgi:2-polyprenyl-3-methyl-5-hydroxy-6-metoxy-1,4-benzoquinol methylase
MGSDGYKDYGYTGPEAGHMHARFLPQVLKFAGRLEPGMRVLDVGCGNGFTCGEFLRRGCKTVGIDLSSRGIEIARRTYPNGRFEVMAAGDQLLSLLAEEPFDLVVSTEVIEHLYAPRDFTRGCFDALKFGGRFIVTTPYHGYLKNVAIALAGKWDSHANPLWDGGHIKLWSRNTLTRVLQEAGFRNMQFRGIGRLPWLWMTMAVACDKPESGPHPQLAAGREKESRFRKPI